METLYSVSRFVYQAVPELPTLLLIVLLALAFWIVLQAQKPGNYWATIFQDEAGKMSALRVAVLFAFAVSSALILYIAMVTKNPADSSGLLWFYCAYMAVWSGAPVAAKALEILATRGK